MRTHKHSHIHIRMRIPCVKNRVVVAAPSSILRPVPVPQNALWVCVWVWVCVRERQTERGWREILVDVWMRMDENEDAEEDEGKRVERMMMMMK
jgi:hypothetical protein